MQTTPVIEVDEATFGTEVLERSYSVPVVVDFWAAWCGPCRTLGPILERLATEANGDWVLAKVDVDANPGLAGMFGVQGIPAVHAFAGGRQVDRFVGALPEAQVREFLRGLQPSAADEAIAIGRDAEERGDLEAARAAYKRALDEEPARLDAKAGLGRVDLAVRTGSADEGALLARADADPTDLDPATALADIEFARGDTEAAFERLLVVIRASSGEERDRARLHLLGLLDTLPPDDARALAARRSLASALY